VGKMVRAGLMESGLGVRVVGYRQLIGSGPVGSNENSMAKAAIELELAVVAVVDL